jgi:hypothetical protein
MMSQIQAKKTKAKKILFKLCHRCGHCNQGEIEPERCGGCQKAFLPLNYFEKVHQDKSAKFQQLFEESENLEESQLIKGLYVLW